MRILHICNDFCGSKVHTNLYRELDGIGVSQTIFTCYRGANREGANQFDAANTDFVYRGVLTTKHRFFFHYKINTVYKKLVEAVNPKQYDLVHAVTMFTDGAVAYRLYKEYGIPYVITVRNTDINEFMVVAPHTWPLGLKILRNARKIIFISKAPKEKFCRHFLIKKILSEIEERMLIIPNGVDDFWLEHLDLKSVKDNHQIIYVGKFDLNKNVERLLKAVFALKDKYPDIKLHLVGGDGGKQDKIMRMVQENSDCLVYHGKIYDKEKLMSLYRQCSIFAMPSIHETFGLVYIEAMSQNLAVLYTRNQGIDGLFDAKVGEAVNAWSVESIKDGLDKLLSERANYSIESVDFETFRWSKIAAYYISLYEDVKKLFKS